MGLFDVFKKKECCICGNEVGLLGNRKLEDGNMCNKCARKLSPWFEDRRSSTVAQIKEQLAYRERNAAQLEDFQVTRTIGEYWKIYIEEVNGVPTRFVVNNGSDYKDGNPDIIAFRDVASCVTDIQVRDEEIKQKGPDGNMVSCNPPRFRHHHEFYIEMDIRNNPYFDDIRFNINSGAVTLESVGGVGGIGGSVVSGILKATAAGNMGVQAATMANFREQRRYEEFRIMCQKIEQAVEDGKRGAGYAAAEQAAVEEPVQAPEVQSGPKFCPHCSAPADGGAFCQYCGGAL